MKSLGIGKVKGTLAQLRVSRHFEGWVGATGTRGMSWKCLNRDKVSEVETSMSLKRLIERKCPGNRV